MAHLTRRTQILLDADRYEKLERRAAETGTSVAALIRQAIDVQLADAGATSRRRQAARALLSAPKPRYRREPDWSEVKGSLRERGR